MKLKEYTPKEQAVFAAVLRLAGQGADLAALRVQQIADAAGMGKGTLYEYFTSKEEIVAGTVLWCLENELRQVSELTGHVATMDELLERAADYIDGLIAERFEAYHIIAGVMKAQKIPGACGVLGALLNRVQAMVDADYRLAQATGWLADGVEQDYFRYVLFSAMVSYAMSLAGAYHVRALTGAEKQNCRQFFRRSVCSCLQKA